MNEEETKWDELGAEACASKLWDWMPGMLTMDGRRIHLLRDLGCIVMEPGKPEASYRRTVAHPDFRDPATLGCLRSLVREAWGETTYTLCTKRGTWFLYKDDGKHVFGGFDSEAILLVTALHEKERQLG